MSEEDFCGWGAAVNEQVVEYANEEGLNSLHTNTSAYGQDNVGIEYKPHHSRDPEMKLPPVQYFSESIYSGAFNNHLIMLNKLKGKGWLFLKFLDAALAKVISQLTPECMISP